MKVSELIEELTKMPPDAMIVVYMKWSCEECGGTICTRKFSKIEYDKAEVIIEVK